MTEEFVEMLSRVQTFSAGSWPYIDYKELNPYYLASYGYTVTKPYVLQCFVCHHQVSIPRQFDADYTETLQSANTHKPNCLYSGQNYSAIDCISKESIYLMMDDLMVQIKQASTAIHELKRYPLLNKDQVEYALVEDSFTFKAIDQGYKLNYNHSIKISFFLQFFGWTVKKDPVSQHELHAECFFCGRKVSLNKVKFIQNDEQPKDHQYPAQQCFSPVSEHRYFCLWVNNRCSNYKGYTIYIQQLFDKMNESKSLFSKRPPEQTKKIRVEMDKYLESFQQKTSEQFDKIKGIFNQCENLRNEIIQQGQQSNKQPLFQESEKRMKEFTEKFIGEEFKDAVKKIKLN